jgi:hypothetical protein
MDRNNNNDSNGNASQLSLNSSRVFEVSTLEMPVSVGQRTPPSLNIRRFAYNVTQFNEDFNPIPKTDEDKYDKFKLDLSKRAWIRRFRSLFPITNWLPEYNIRQNLFADILVGITIAIFQVPESIEKSLFNILEMNTLKKT